MRTTRKSINDESIPSEHMLNVRSQFEPFGGLKSVIHAAAAGISGSQRLEVRDWEGVKLEETDSDYAPPLLQDVELIYIAFDIIYLDDSSVSHLQLEDRLKLLERLIPAHDAAISIPGSSVKGRVVPLLPGMTKFHDILVSRRASSEAEIQTCLDQTAKLKDEGILIKALDSPWISNDRSGSWLKMKLDYIRNMDIDAAILGGW